MSRQAFGPAAAQARRPARRRRTALLPGQSPMALADLGSFRPYSPTHAAVILFVAAVTWAAVSLRRRWRNTPRARRLDVAVATVAFAAWVFVRTFKCLPGRYDASKALPLQVCDLVGLIAP